MKKILLTAALALTGLLSQAQQDSARFMHSIGFGYQYTQFDGVAAQMPATFGNSYNLDAGAFTMNFACYSIYKRFMFGGEFGGLRREANDDDFMTSTVSQGFGYFNFGFLVLDKPRCMAYPFVGIGGVYSGLAIKNKTSADWVNQDFIIRADQKGNFSSFGGSINAGLAFKKAFDCDRYDKQLLVGLDLGVHITPQSKHWEYNGSDERIDTFGTADNIGYYARVTIGGLMTRYFDRSEYMRK